jgi:hypothetical protein
MASACGPSGAARPAGAAGTAGAGAGAAGAAPDQGLNLTSFGATMAAWNTHHRSAAAYSNVTPQNGRVVEYTVDTKAITIADAIKRAKQELPADSRELWGTRKGNCYQVELTSHTIGQALVSTGDSGGGILAIMNTLLPNGSSVYRSAGVNEIMLSPGSYSTAADAPDC